MDDKQERMVFSFSTNEQEGPQLTVTYQDEVMHLDLDGIPDEVLQRLMLEGLKAYLQRKTYRTSQEDKISTMEGLYNELIEKGVEVFETSAAPTRLLPHKESRVAALAMLKKTTPAAVRRKLAEVGPEKARELLTHPKVVQLAAELQDADVDI
jgi:hypothetical protein